METQDLTRENVVLRCMARHVEEGPSAPMGPNKDKDEDVAAETSHGSCTDTARDGVCVENQPPCGTPLAIF